MQHEAQTVKLSQLNISGRAAYLPGAVSLMAQTIAISVSEGQHSWS